MVMCKGEFSIGEENYRIPIIVEKVIKKIGVTTVIAKEVKSSCNSKCLPTKVLGCKFKFRNKHLPKKWG